MPQLISCIAKKFASCTFSVLLSVACTSGFALESVTADEASILTNQSDKLTVWNLKNNPSIYIFDFPGLLAQGKSFNRITHFTEQADFSSGYPKVYNNAEMAEYFDSVKRTQANFAYGHDIQISEFVQFFNLIDRDKIEIFPEEIVVRDFLVEKGLIKTWRGFYQALQPNAVILSIPQLQQKNADEPQVTDFARRAVFSHELSHGEYFSNEYYANYCRKFWNETLTDKQRKLFSDFLGKHNYNINYLDLVVNEMQAYLIFTSDQNSFNAAKLGVTELELETMRKMFRQGKPPTKLLSK